MVNLWAAPCWRSLMSCWQRHHGPAWQLRWQQRQRHQQRQLHHAVVQPLCVPPPLQGVFHRDLQLNAVRLDACGGVVLTDFGYSAAKLLGSGEHADARDRAASPAFTPPEVLLGHSIVNTSYDGESLGEELSSAFVLSGMPLTRGCDRSL